MSDVGAQGRSVTFPYRFLFVRALVGLLAAIAIGIQGACGAAGGSFTPAFALAGWLLLSSCIVIVHGRWRTWSQSSLAFSLFGDCVAASAVVRATGSLHSPTLLLLALPVLAGGLIFLWRMGLLFGLFTALFYGLMALEQSRRGMLPGALWSLVIFHTIFFASMGVAAGVLARRMASSLQEVAETRSELETVRLSTDRIVESLSCGLIALDASGEVRSLNPEARRLLNLDETARRIPELVAGHNGPLLKMVEKGLTGGPGGRDAEIILWGGRGRSFPAWVKVAPVIDGQGQTRGLVALFWDITERKRLEELARRRERLATVGELSAGLAHEIRNSLKPITGSIELLQTRTDLPTEVRPLMELITREADSLEAFLSQFLGFALDKTLKLEGIDLEELIREEVRALGVGRSWADRTVEVTGGAGICMQGDREWLRQVFRNLILNALEAAAEGKVEVLLERFESDGQPWTSVRVIDEGPGLEGMGEGEAFLPFCTTKPAGTGLGLPIAQRGVEEHGGRIAFDPNWPKGGCVVVELPQAALRPGGGPQGPHENRAKVA